MTFFQVAVNLERAIKMMLRAMDLISGEGKLFSFLEAGPRQNNGFMQLLPQEVAGRKFGHIGSHPDTAFAQLQ